jgi:hypothetical protein
MTDVQQQMREEIVARSLRHRWDIAATFPRHFRLA